MPFTPCCQSESRFSPSSSSEQSQDVALINALSDDDLLSIFKRLPPYERLFVSQVCKRWFSINGKAWVDITRLDLSPIPGPNISAIAKRCPKLSVVSAVHKSFDLNELRCLAHTSLCSLNFHECTPTMLNTGNSTMDPFSVLFAGILQGATWEELVLHELGVKLQPTKRRRPLASYFHASLPLALKRLQITGGQVVLKPQGSRRIQYEHGLAQLTQLECLMLHQTMHDTSRISLNLLRELYISHHFEPDFKGFLARLPKLEVLFVHNCPAGFDLSELAKHPSLRILVLTGYFGQEVQFPTRPLYGNGFSADPLPQLHIFVGKRASKMMLFPKFLPNAAKAYPITEPLPQFLDRADIKPIFEGVWIAAKIREATGHRCSELFDYGGDVAVSLRSLAA